MFIFSLSLSLSLFLSFFLSFLRLSRPLIIMSVDKGKQTLGHKPAVFPAETVYIASNIKE